jgi:hypothetical protein
MMGGIALGALYMVGFAILASGTFARAPELIAFAVTLDLTITATVIAWWFGVRRSALPPWVAFAVFSWGVVVARLWVPHAPIRMLVAVGALAEVVTMGWLLLRIRRVIRTARAARDEGPIGSIEAGLIAARMPGRIATIIASEVAVVRLALTGWFRRPERGAMSMRSTGWLTYVGVFGFLLIVETIVTHVLLATMWSPVAAWVATAGSAYMLLWLIGDAQAIRLHPVAIDGEKLRVMIGVRWRAAIPLSAIASVTEIHSVPDGALNLALIEPTVLVTLREPVVVRGLLGMRRRADRLALTIDDPKAFAAAVA